jgi:hypothetical protein
LSSAGTIYSTNTAGNGGSVCGYTFWIGWAGTTDIFYLTINTDNAIRNLIV